MHRLLHVVGARPNFMKIAPLLRELRSRKGFENVLVHTGQHYDEEMSGGFFRDLQIPAPDFNLGVGSGSHARQTGAVLMAMEEKLLEVEPDLVVVVGDVNSTIASALAAAKLHIPVAHVEAGLRSRDRRMPEELNRILTDQLSDLCLTPSRDADENLKAEGISNGRIHFVGNIMIDSLHFTVSRADVEETLERFGVADGGYGLVTLHRPSNVDDRETLEGIVRALDRIADELPILFPAHPRTRNAITEFGLEPSRVRLIEPVSYPDMVALLKGAGILLTDSGGLQEESTALGVPCLTLRSTTERPVTVTEGTNTLVRDRSTDSILRAYEEKDRTRTSGRIPEGWDGATAARIADVFEDWLRDPPS